VSYGLNNKRLEVYFIKDEDNNVHNPKNDTGSLRITCIISPSLSWQRPNCCTGAFSYCWCSIFYGIGSALFGPALPLSCIPPPFLYSSLSLSYTCALAPPLSPPSPKYLCHRPNTRQLVLRGRRSSTT
jgi:hypothetical protein